MNLLVRADASAGVGRGHVMRTLALAQAWSDAGGTATFALAQPAPDLVALLARHGMAVIDLPVDAGSVTDAVLTSSHAGRLGAVALVLDGYGFDAKYQRLVRTVGAELAVIDDAAHLPLYDADIVLNHNLYADPAMYAGRAPRARLVLGARYALLRRDFIAWRQQQRTPAPAVRHLLISFGGSDVQNMAPTALAAVARALPGRSLVRIVAGPSNPRLRELSALVDGQSGVEVLVDGVDMPAQMAWADLVIGAAGSTTWELAMMGAPALLVIVAENQARIAESAAAAGIARSVGWHADVTVERLAAAVAELAGDAEARVEMSARGRALIDGGGAARVVAALRIPAEVS